MNHRFKIQKKCNFLQGYPILQEYLEKKYRAALDPPESDYAQLETKIRERARTLGTSQGTVDFFLEGVGLRNEN
ncbi:hypothetical protein, partial [Burkholderia cenocepacia]|uniref:hypothetical protein n=1 Tax=Burkholderia cenocepacia TaxID=95486 RepID=UPI001C8B00F9